MYPQHKLYKVPTIYAVMYRCLRLVAEGGASEEASEERLSKQRLESKPSTLSSSSKEQLV